MEAGLFDKKWLLTATICHTVNPQDFGYYEDTHALKDERMAGMVIVTVVPSSLKLNGEAVL